MLVACVCMSGIITVFHRHAPCAECFTKLYIATAMSFSLQDKKVRQLTFESDGPSRMGPSVQWIRTNWSRDKNAPRNSEWASSPRIAIPCRLGMLAFRSARALRLLPNPMESGSHPAWWGECVGTSKRARHWSRRDDIVASTQKDGQQGWVHNFGHQGELLMIPHSLRHRITSGRPSKLGN